MGARSNPAKKPTRTMAVLVTEYGGATHLTLIRWRAVVTLLRERPNLPDERFRKKVLYAILGIQTLQKARWCRGALEVTNSAAQSGYGPVLYDTALVVADRLGAPGVIPDRREVSPAARRLWAFYRDQRPDVTAERLGLFCPRHQWLGVDVLDHVYTVNREIAGIEGLLSRGGDTYAKLVQIAGGEEEALSFIAAIRLVFWQCYFHGVCPMDVKPTSDRVPGEQQKEVLVLNPRGDLRPFPAALWERSKAWARMTYDKHSAYSMMAAAKWFKERGGVWIGEGEGGTRKWLDERWVDICTDDLKPCGRQKGEARGGYPKCLPKAKAKAMTKAQRKDACARKRKAERKAGGKQTWVSTKRDRGKRALASVLRI